MHAAVPSVSAATLLAGAAQATTLDELARAHYRAAWPMSGSNPLPAITG